MKYIFCLFAMFPMMVWAGGQYFKNLEDDIRLTIGDPAPSLNDLTWISRKPAKFLERPKRVYVVEFWGSWCGPCISSIPHLNELATKYKGKVDIVGVAASEMARTDEARLEVLKKFLASSGHVKQVYPVAFGPQVVKERWLGAALALGIPRAFIVQNGTLVWEGHPMEMDDALMTSILAGSWNSEAYKAKLLKGKIEAAASNRVKWVLGNLRDEDKLDVLDEFFREYPEARMAASFETQRLAVLLRLNHLDRLEAIAEQMIENGSDDKVILALEGHLSSPRVLKLAVKAVDRMLADMAAHEKTREYVHKYAHYYLKATSTVLMAAGRNLEATEHVKLALKALAEDREDAKLKEVLEARLAQLEPALIAKVEECSGGVCAMPENLSACDDAIIGSANKAGGDQAKK